jgi:hypothetical protein
VKLVRSTVKSLGHNFFALAGIYCVMLVSGCGGGSTPPPPPTVSVSVSPKRAAITTGQTQSFAATVTGSSNTNVTWGVDTIAGGNATVGTIDASGKYTPPASGGAHTVTATSVADGTKSASASVGVTDLAGVFTYHNNISRDGSNIKEYALTPANVTTSTFGKLFSCAVDGAIYAQPLWVANVTIGSAKHNVIVVATQHDSVYAFDADANPCVTLWHFSLLDTAHGGTSGEGTVPSGATGGLVGSGYGDITAEVGITGTPVIDPSTNTLYVVSKSVNGAQQFFQRLHALDLLTGLEKPGSPANIDKTITVIGTGDGSAGGILAFDPQNQNQRPGLALVNGLVYITWASHEDHSPYHGWVIAFSAASLARVAAFNTTPNGGLGGIWMSGAAPAFDTSGNAFFATGNGTFIIGDEYGDSIVKLGPAAGGTFPVLDYFTPFNQNSLNGSDGDLGSGGVLLLPDLPLGSAHPHLLIQVGKEGKVYLVDRNTGQMGQYCNGCVSDNVVQELPGAVNGMWGMPAYWNGNIYTGGAQDGASGDTMKAFSFNAGGSGLISSSPTSVSSQTYTFSGPTPSVSANGTSNGIIWALDNSQHGPPAQASAAPTVLHAYDATNLATELWNSSQAAGGRDTAGFAVKFTVPTIANGKVYIGTRGNDSTQGSPTIKGEIDVYGLLPN